MKPVKLLVLLNLKRQAGDDPVFARLKDFADFKRLVGRWARIG